ncbi:hypothetical protein [Elizabethkingia sp. M8]|uniref:hypothetical protein n=1 Tax=Elizabethkingia sp. M8 TaxID=2796140 RepID=UPI0019050B42|nr:hypothetical protein [Elizabethkingia sp. M8]QQM26582.1 hypothetical protein JCR23_17350 [Elizabethkingia sp. M8]
MKTFYDYTIIYSCSLNCGSGRDIGFLKNDIIPKTLEQLCPACEKGKLIFDKNKTLKTYKILPNRMAD